MPTRTNPVSKRNGTIHARAAVDDARHDSLRSQVLRWYQLQLLDPTFQPSIPLWWMWCQVFSHTWSRMHEGGLINARHNEIRDGVHCWKVRPNTRMVVVPLLLLSARLKAKSDCLSLFVVLGHFGVIVSTITWVIISTITWVIGCW